MKTNLNSTNNKFTGAILVSAIALSIFTGCASTPSAGFSDATTRSKTAMHLPRIRAVVGNLVALLHNGKKIYVNDVAVAAHLSRGDTLALNEDGKTVYGEERELRAYLDRS